MGANKSGLVSPPSVFMIVKASVGFVNKTLTVSTKALKNPSCCRCSQGSPLAGAGPAAGGAEPAAAPGVAPAGGGETGRATAKVARGRQSGIPASQPRSV